MNCIEWMILFKWFTYGPTHPIGKIGWQYEKSCLLKPHYPKIKVHKQLTYNYITTRAWKYK
jgi:hypothetical protein